MNVHAIELQALVDFSESEKTFPKRTKTKEYANGYNQGIIDFQKNLDEHIELIKQHKDMQDTLQDPSRVNSICALAMGYTLNDEHLGGNCAWIKNAQGGADMYNPMEVDKENAELVKRFKLNIIHDYDEPDTVTAINSTSSDSQFLQFGTATSVRLAVCFCIVNMNKHIGRNEQLYINELPQNAEL